MPRLIFPADRSAFVYSGPGQPILTPDRNALQIFLDEGCTAQADILTMDGVTIGNATVYTDASGLFPEFLGPVDVVRLWGKSPGGPAVPIDANYGNRLDTIAGSIGVPLDGSPGQVLRKVSPVDFDTEWADPAVTAGQVSDASAIGRQVLTSADRRAALEALGIFIQPTKPTGWGPAQANFIWIKTPI